MDNRVHGDNLYPNPLCHGAAAFLLHTRDFTLHFGTAYKSANAWYNVGDKKWCTTLTTITTTANAAASSLGQEEEEEMTEPRLRPHVCDSGRVVDWILEYAWHYGFLQHIPRIRLTGDVQPWVREKWYAIFAAQAEHNKQLLAATTTTASGTATPTTPATPTTTSTAPTATATTAPASRLQRNALLEPFTIHRPRLGRFEEKMTTTRILLILLIS